uniref:G-protein coupled receptor 157-like n=1 Tax=Crassostrea virginica TaxID=6565 RepID=A0A8B8EUX5_CRAVI|nr:G-protein coupled receptor 157-like [Crassostrea virginica]
MVKTGSGMFTNMSSNNSSSENMTSSDPLSLSPFILGLSSLSCCLSIIGAMIIFATYYLVAVAKNQTRRLLLYLTIADLMTAVGNLIGIVRYVLREETEYIVEREEMKYNCTTTDTVCVLQSVVTTFSNLASFFWTTIIMIHILMTLFTQQEWSKFANRVIYHIVAWGVPLVITFLAIWYDVLGEDFFITTGPWCWIKGCMEQDKVIYWMALTGKGWEVATYFLSMTFYIIIKFYMVKRSLHFKHRSQNHLREEDELYIMIFFVIIILRAAGTTRFFIAVVKNAYFSNIQNFDAADRGLLYVQSLGDSAQAFANCILFCIRDTAVRQDMWRRIRSCVGCRSPDEEERARLLQNVVN